MSKQTPKPLVETISNRTFHYFREISQIPRGSGKEQAVADYLTAFAGKNNFSFKRSTEVIKERQTCDVVIYKPGTLGYESLDTVVLQAHFDMVCQKTKDSAHNFDTDPIEIIMNGNQMTANGTTLGADDGIGVALMLAILESQDISHPPIEAFFTSDEEDGMTGVVAVTGEMISGRRLINIDSEDEGVFTYGSAGGIDANVILPITYEPTPDNFTFLHIEVAGLMGGHSGVEIHKGRANAHLLLARVLGAIEDLYALRLVSVHGGDKRNVITREAGAVIGIASENVSGIKKLAEEQRSIFAHEYESIETNIQITVNQDSLTHSQVISAETTDKFIMALLTLPNDIHSMHNNVENLVGTSCNIGIILQDEESFSFCSHIRSFHHSKKLYVLDKFRRIARLLGARFSDGNDYPVWEPNLDSDLIKRFKYAYENTFTDKKPHFESIHAGLECGFISKKFPDMDMISCGPTITGAHTPEEMLDIDSTKRTIELLLNILTQMADDIADDI